VKNGGTPAVNVIKVNPTDNNTVIAAGRFDSAGSLGCVNICSWNVQAGQWQSLGSGVQGNISDLTYYNVSFPSRLCCNKKPTPNFAFAHF
jgi:hypothetical protein